MTLVILAAGMGSRYGGLKQIDPMTENGEFIIDFSIFDAIRAGFDKVVFVIKEENYELFRDTVSKRIEGRIEVEYCFQKMDDIPLGSGITDEYLLKRKKPWGTAHAVLAARNAIKGDFAVINADDFYGKGAYEKISAHFAGINDKTKESRCCMVGYRLGNTLTEGGAVSRGICSVTDDFVLVSVTERTSITPFGDDAIYVEAGEGHVISSNSIASMNCWGLTEDTLDLMWNGFKNFLCNLDPDDEGFAVKEYYLPFAVSELIDSGKISVKVYFTNDRWYGVTYAQDKEKVRTSICQMIDRGQYPHGLWK